MAWRKSIRNLFHADHHQNVSPSRPQFFESQELTLLDASTLPPIRKQTTAQEQHTLFIQKLKLCSIVCDFR